MAASAPTTATLEELRTHWHLSRLKARLIPSIALAGKWHDGWPKVILISYACLMKSFKDTVAVTVRVFECWVVDYATAWLNEFSVQRGASR